MDVEHGLLAKKLDEELNNAMIIEVERKPTKKRLNVSSSEIFEFFLQNFLIRRMKCSRRFFLKI